MLAFSSLLFTTEKGLWNLRKVPTVTKTLPSYLCPCKLYLHTYQTHQGYCSTAPALQIIDSRSLDCILLLNQLHSGRARGPQKSVYVQLIPTTVSPMLKPVGNKTKPSFHRAA